MAPNNQSEYSRKEDYFENNISTTNNYEGETKESMPVQQFELGTGDSLKARKVYDQTASVTDEEVATMPDTQSYELSQVRRHRFKVKIIK